ncbi:hypothetical protein QF91_003916 [Salmonella enterica subsp. salamae]|nr:hypothetical protein [Salmonella enterica]EDV0904685.1 hypothetical protein [Salmonella enterica subsp. salamae]EHM1752301.1 hypothetical protein [Salmonella enterica subsp. salamae serovar 40:c:e,n,x,z15]EIU8982971.1 hypothetical protein [Salmonella enterica]
MASFSGNKHQSGRTLAEAKRRKTGCKARQKRGGKRENFSVADFSYKKQRSFRYLPALFETWLKKYLVLLAKPMVTL